VSGILDGPAETTPATSVDSGVGPSASFDADVLVVGAGIAGLLAAHRLVEAGHSVVVVDKGRGVGGRLATRRMGEGVFDHGAQFFTSSEPAFAAEVAHWEAAGVVQRWFDTRLEPDGSVVPDGHPRWRGATGMTAIAKHLAIGLDVRTSTRLASLGVESDGSAEFWRAIVDDGSELRAGAVLLTPPIPQTLDLLAAGGVMLEPAQRAELESVSYHPCLAVMALLDGPSGLPEPGALRPGSEPLDWVADNQRKGISPVPSITVHAGPATSRALWDAPDDEVIATLLGAVPGLAASPVADGVQVQRWRYARPDVGLEGFTRKISGVHVAVLAGDVFDGSRVPGAAASGWAAAELLLSLI
jgi:predicted NAD/FAD-dependent oxidoreductase